MNTTTPRPTQSSIRGWQSDGVLIARSRSMTGRIYRIASYRHYLRCDASLPCPAFEHRGVCQHVKDAARFLEEHSACGEAQRRFSEQTYNDPLRTAIRAQRPDYTPLLDLDPRQHTPDFPSDDTPLSPGTRVIYQPTSTSGKPYGPPRPGVIHRIVSVPPYSDSYVVHVDSGGWYGAEPEEVTPEPPDFPTPDELDDYDYEAEREEYEAEFGHLSADRNAPMHRSVVVPSPDPRRGKLEAIYR